MRPVIKFISRTLVGRCYVPSMGCHHLLDDCVMSCQAGISICQLLCQQLHLLLQCYGLLPNNTKLCQSSVTLCSGSVSLRLQLICLAALLAA